MPMAAKTLREVGFNGLAVPDHYPPFVEGGCAAGKIYTIGYMRVSIERVKREVGI